MTQYTPAQRRGVTNVPEQNQPEPAVEPRPPIETSQEALTGGRAVTGVDFEKSVHRGEGVDLDACEVLDGPWTIPGRGAKGDRCGVVAPNGFCDADDPHVTFGRHDCGRRSCPRCWFSSWRNPRTVEVTARLGAARYDAEGAGKRCVHAVVSPESGETGTIEQFYQNRSEAIQVAKRAGIRGGIIVPHGFRVKKRIQEKIEQEREAGNFSGGDWKWVREHDCSWHNFVYWSPHYHVIGLSRDVDPSNVSDEWVVHNIKRKRADGEVGHSLAPFTLTGSNGYKDMARTVGYTLSHATYEADSNRQVMTWFGDLHGSNFDPEEDISDGPWSKIHRKARVIVGSEGDDGGDGAGDDDDDRECLRGGCEGTWHPIHEAPDFLDQRGNDIPEDAYDRIHTAWLWDSGDLEPPPGLKRPTTEEGAREAFAEMLNGEP